MLHGVPSHRAPSRPGRGGWLSEKAYLSHSRRAGLEQLPGQLRRARKHDSHGGPMTSSLIPIVGVLVAALAFASGSGGASGGGPAPDVAALVQTTEDANKALVRGDIDKYVALTHHA